MASIVAFVFWLRELLLEILQRKLKKATCKERFVRFFTEIQFFNKNDMIHLSLLLVLQVINLVGVHHVGLETAAILAALAVFSLMIKSYEWLRIFDKAAFYIYLIGQTIVDIRAFIILVIISLLMFGLPLMMLNYYTYVDTPVFDTLSGFSLADSMMNQYYLSLGEFNTENYSKHPLSVIIFLIFVGATMFTQITMLNMLIAIMGDTFDKVNENSIGIKRWIKLDLMEEYAGFLTYKYPEDSFIFKITVDQEEFEDFDSWEGSLNHIKKINEKNFNEIKTNYGKQMRRLQQLEEKVNEFASRDVSKQIFASQSKTIARFDLLDNKIERLQETLKKKDGGAGGSLSRYTAAG